LLFTSQLKARTERINRGRTGGIGGGTGGGGEGGWEVGLLEGGLETGQKETARLAIVR